MSCVGKRAESVCLTALTRVADIWTYISLHLLSVGRCSEFHSSPPATPCRETCFFFFFCLSALQRVPTNRLMERGPAHLEPPLARPLAAALAAAGDPHREHRARRVRPPRRTPSPNPRSCFSHTEL